ncbi:DUF2130 domain-containing protein [Candidatus Roizmanbacteria bacterium CG_4_9_14_0_8_um_filter_34_12]|uniref:DUF2130 domain-containing protein n=3 Tax=Patescibacteria group TaxID=1783273 RepID=A0A2M8DDJ4_9BACT|nr:MAG: DUF2130 domain-containing protein [Candidatus Roizmanbacteria bacterium CG_4_9_14_0_8_um_filter_34_12]
MNDQIICPHCKKPIPLTEALSHQLQEKYQTEYRQKYFDAVKKKEHELTETLKIKIAKEMEMQLKDKANEIDDLRKQNKQLQEQFLELNRLIRSLKTENEQKNIEMEKKLIVEQEKIREEEKKRQDETYRMKMLEYDKKLQDALKTNDDLKRKLEQGSQQTQGEVLELELENILKQEFPYDEISPVAKGVKGGDIIQTIKNQSGRDCGKVIWEMKRTKAWSEGWVSKLKEDQRQVKADVSILITQVLPNNIKNFGLYHDVWVGGFDAIIGLAMAVRSSLISLAGIKQSMVGKAEKKEILWNYLTGIEFRQRVEAIYEAYQQQRIEIQKERDWFTKKWAKEEKNTQLVLENILGMHGDLEGIVGKTLPEIKGLKMLLE